MTLREELASKKDALVALKERIEANDAEAIAQGEILMDEIVTKTAELEQAEKKADLLNSIGTTTESEESEMENTGIKSMNLEELKAAPGSKSVMLKAATDPITSTAENTYDHNVVDPRVGLNVRALFGTEQISTNALTYYVLGSMTGTIGTVAEGAKKGQVNIGYTPKTVALSKIAAFFKETDELLADNAFLESAIRNRGIYEFQKAVESYLVTTLIGTSGVQTGGNAITFDNILAAKQDIMADTGYAPDALLINPADWATLLQTKDSNLQYLLGGPAFGSYGNGGYFANPKVWGLNVVESAAVPSGKAVIGAFKAGASVVTKAGEGFRVEVSNSDGEDFVYNRITVRLEERLVEAVRVPAAFEIIGA